MHGHEPLDVPDSCMDGWLPAQELAVKIQALMFDDEEAMLNATCCVQTVKVLLDWACTAERLLRSADTAAAQAAEGEAYLQQPVRYSDGKLLDSQGEAVMMEWEKPLMLAHANLLCQNGGDVLNVGFGLGLIDESIQGHVAAII
jgi:hypothetical protein